MLRALATAGPRGAMSHSLLLGSDPAEGTALMTPPTAITLHFNEAVRPTALRLCEPSTPKARRRCRIPNSATPHAS